jgi:hypothetical protein
MTITSISAAEPGWKAIFGEPPEQETQSRIVAWALLDSGDVAGLVVDPQDRTKIVPASEVRSPEGAAFARYGFKAAEPPTSPPISAAAPGLGDLL